MSADAVKCGGPLGCGWRGRRLWTFPECDCEYSCPHGPHGDCPRCGKRLRTVADWRAIEQRDRETEAFFATPEGRALLSAPASSKESDR